VYVRLGTGFCGLVVTFFFWSIGFWGAGYKIGDYFTLLSGVVASLGGLKAIELGNETLWLCMWLGSIT
jgi:hypothetical protein